MFKCTRNRRIRLLIILSGFMISIYIILQFMYANVMPDGPENTWQGLCTDIDDLGMIVKKFKSFLYIFDKNLFNVEIDIKMNRRGFFYNEAVELAIDLGSIESSFEQLLDFLDFNGFRTVIVYGTRNDPERLVGLSLKRYATIYVYFIHAREEGTWWFRDMKTNISHRSYPKEFEAVPVPINGVMDNVIKPKDISNFLNDLKDSQFVECNKTVSEAFSRLHAVKDAQEVSKFRHRASKLLNKVKTVFNILKIPFWLSSGTCLGFFRQCDIIPYTKDVDIGVYAKHYTEDITTKLEDQGVYLWIWFGEVNDSLELSFIDHSGLKLDIFFFYEEGDFVWNGGTQEKTGLKFKYTFPKFALCWTFFLDMKLRVPCDTETYLAANYGKNWFKPVFDWDWKKSPFNVKKNGKWPLEKQKSVIKRWF